LGFVGKDNFCITNNDSAVLEAFFTSGTVQWYRDNVAISGATQKKYRATQSGTYYAIITNGKGCSDKTTPKKITIEIPEKAIRYPIVNAVKNLPMQIDARAIGVSAFWSPGIYLSSSISYQPIFTGTLDKEYLIKLTTTGGCVTIDTQAVRVFAFMDVYVPTAFTPNNDGVNDYIFPIASGYKKINYFKIFNRWGKQVFDLAQNERGWDGVYKGVAQPVQTYVWMVEGIGADNKVYRKKGTCVLIR
jgi:gliding motility-associated-like protein